MTLPSSFPLSVSQINVELGRSAGAAFNITGSAERTLAGVPSGPISFSDFLGKSNTSASYNGFYTGSGSNTSIGGVSFGSAASDRIIVVGISWQWGGGNNVPVSGVGIGGVGATIVRQSSHSGGATGLGGAIAYAPVPSGTSGTVLINFTAGGATPFATVGVYRLAGMSLVDSNIAANAGSMGDLTIPLATSANSAVIAVHTISTAGAHGVNWIGVTEQYDSAWASGALATGVPAGSRNVTADVASIGDAGNVLAGVSFA